MNKVSASSIFKKYSVFLFDCDGVFFKGVDQIAEGVEFANKLIEEKKNVFFLSNNNSVHRHNLFDKLIKFGVNADKSRVYNSSYLTALYLKQRHPEVKRIYAIGREGVVDQLKEQGFEVEGGPAEDTKEMSFDESETFVMEDDKYDAVVASYDQNLNFYKTNIACQAIQKAKVFVATNPDRFLIKKGLKHPGTGCYVTFFETATERKAVICGKPNPLAYETILNDHGLNPDQKEEVIMVGDNLETDIKFGNGIGIDTLLVLTGVTKAETLEKSLKQESSGKPTYILETLSL